MIPFTKPPDASGNKNQPFHPWALYGWLWATSGGGRSTGQYIYQQMKLYSEKSTLQIPWNCKRIECRNKYNLMSGLSSRQEKAITLLEKVIWEQFSQPTFWQKLILTSDKTTSLCFKVTKEHPSPTYFLLNFSNLNTHTDKSLLIPLPHRTHCLPKLPRSLPSVAKALLQFHLSCDVYR